jgi:cell division protein FtsI (penicillin-binding protein 3)
MNLLPKQKDGSTSYSSAFIGYFPTSHPKYTCFVLIKNKPDAPNYYGASVAAPIVREIATYYLTK